MNKKTILQTVGPGLLFASSSIGTSHLVLSTRAGAHHGMIFFWIILACLLLKYPFFEFSPRYVSATGHSLLKGYKDQGLWAVVLFTIIIGISMFAVVGAVGAVTAGLLSTMVGMNTVSMPVLLALVLGFTAVLLWKGGYKALDNFVKILSIVLLLSVFIAFVAVLFKGPVQPVEEFIPPKLLEGAGFALLISLVGWMPTGMEASALHSFWILENEKSNKRRTSLKDSLFDFNLGYMMTVALAIMFMIIGTYTVYGSGDLLEGNSTEFSNKLLNIFTSSIGGWAYPIIAIAALGTIYGTLITAWDAFSRGFVRAMRIFKFDKLDKSEEQERFVIKFYPWMMAVIGLGGYALFIFSSSSMIKILEGATIFSFVAGPVIAFLNLRAIQGDNIPESFRPSRKMIYLAYLGLGAMSLFAIYYLTILLTSGSIGH